jgi:hypothetical protein
MANEINNLEALRAYFTTQISAIDSLEIQLEALRESLKLLVPGFEDTFRKQQLVVARRRAETTAKQAPDSPTKADQVVQSIQALRGK